MSIARAWEEVHVSVQSDRKVKGRKTVTYKEALSALIATFHERIAQEPIGPASQDYFYGCCDRWSMVIQEFNRCREKGRILDIGAHEGFLCGALVKLGYSAAALDFEFHVEQSIWAELGVEWQQCHIEADLIPFPDEHFIGVYMGQLLEHFTYSPKKPFEEIRRVLKPGGLLVVDVPNVAEWHNFYRLIRGKNTLWDYKKHYIDYEPYVYKGRPYFDRHNREFTRRELKALAETCRFEALRVRYVRSRRFKKKGLRLLETPFTALRDLIPIFRKGIMLTARRP
jgi:SAM-dependent methyltransferase